MTSILVEVLLIGAQLIFEISLSPEESLIQ